MFLGGPAGTHVAMSWNAAWAVFLHNLGVFTRPSTVFQNGPGAWRVSGPCDHVLEASWAGFFEKVPKSSKAPGIWKGPGQASLGGFKGSQELPGLLQDPPGLLEPPGGLWKGPGQVSLRGFKGLRSFRVQKRPGEFGGDLRGFQWLPKVSRGFRNVFGWCRNPCGHVLERGLGSVPPQFRGFSGFSQAFQGFPGWSKEPGEFRAHVTMSWKRLGQATLGAFRVPGAS